VWSVRWKVHNKFMNFFSFQFSRSFIVNFQHGIKVLVVYVIWKEYHYIISLFILTLKKKIGGNFILFLGVLDITMISLSFEALKSLMIIIFIFGRGWSSFFYMKRICGKPFNNELWSSKNWIWKDFFLRCIFKHIYSWR
jgi:hypothetical protein